MTVEKLVVQIFISIVALFLFQEQFVFSVTTKQCLCPHHVDKPGVFVGFCGHEVIEKRASAKPSTRICKPTFVYLCTLGPNRATFEAECQDNETCIPGSAAYKKVKHFKNQTSNMDLSSSHLRFCATNEGKTSYFLQLSIPYEHQKYYIAMKVVKIGTIVFLKN